MDQTTELMLLLLRCSLSGQQAALPPISTDTWEKIYWLARKNGVVTLVNDAIERLPSEEKPQGDIALSWELSAERTRYHFGHQAQVLETIRKKADEAKINFVLLKGMSLAKLYPRPNSRPCGDIDIYFPGNYAKGNEILGNPDAPLNGKHSELEIDGVPIENHLYFLDQNYRSQKKAEAYIVNSLGNASKEGDLCPMANMVYLLMHMACHLIDKYKLPLRNMIDWGIFIRTYQGQLNPKECHKVMRSLNMEPAFDTLTHIAGELVGADFSTLVNKKNIRKKDEEKLLDLILNQNDLPPVPKDLQPLQKLMARRRRHKQRRWLYRYLSSSRSERIRTILHQLFGRI